MCYYNERKFEGGFIMERIKDNTIDFTTVITKEELLELSAEDIALAKKDGGYHSRYLRNSFEGGTLVERLASRSREIAFLGHKYRDKSDTFKELLAANIAFGEDEKFIRVLLSKNINYYQLFSYARAVKSIKKITALTKELEADEIKIASRKLSRLCKIIKDYFGIKDYNLILAKIAEITAFQKDLYKKLEEEQFEKSKTKGTLI